MKCVYVLTLLCLMGSLMLSSPASAQCICPANYAPVCGTNGVTYSNTCRLTCAGAKLKHGGKCGRRS